MGERGLRLAPFFVAACDISECRYIHNGKLPRTYRRGEHPHTRATQEHDACARVAAPPVARAPLVARETHGLRRSAASPTFAVGEAPAALARRYSPSSTLSPYLQMSPHKRKHDETSMPACHESGLRFDASKGAAEPAETKARPPSSSRARPPKPEPTPHKYLDARAQALYGSLERARPFLVDKCLPLPIDNKVPHVIETELSQRLFRESLLSEENAATKRILSHLKKRCPASPIWALATALFLALEYKHGVEVNLDAVKAFASDLFAETDGARACWTYSVASLTDALSRCAATSGLEPAEREALVEAAIPVYLEMIDTIPATLLEHMKWLNIKIFLRPAFCAVLLDEYGFSIEGATEGLKACGLERFKPEYVLLRASSVRYVPRSSDNFDAFDSIGENHPIAVRCRFGAIVAALVEQGQLDDASIYNMVSFEDKADLTQRYSLQDAKGFLQSFVVAGVVDKMLKASQSRGGACSQPPKTLPIRDHPIATASRGALLSGAASSDAARRDKGVSEEDIEKSSERKAAGGALGGVAPHAPSTRAPSTRAPSTHLASESLPALLSGAASSDAARRDKGVSEEDIEKSSERKGNSSGNTSGMSGPIGDGPRTWHACKKCGVTFAVKATTKVARHMPDSCYCGTCVGGSGCTGCAFV